MTQSTLLSKDPAGQNKEVFDICRRQLVTWSWHFVPSSHPAKVFPPAALWGQGWHVTWGGLKAQVVLVRKSQCSRTKKKWKWQVLFFMSFLTFMESINKHRFFFHSFSLYFVLSVSKLCHNCKCIILALQHSSAVCAVFSFLFFFFNSAAAVAVCQGLPQRVNRCKPRRAPMHYPAHGT